MNKLIRVMAAAAVATFITFIALYSAFLIVTKDAKLNPGKLVDYEHTICFLDGEGNKIEEACSTTGKSSIKLENLPNETIYAFIAAEDRNFYAHRGLNYKRMAVAFFKNLRARSFKEGASTISQQLIKNTHLSSDKKISRKLKEIKLTKKLEKLYDKDSILEMYLNTIYFGHNCYGLESAANYYFNESAEELTLEQSATIVGLLASPNNYSPFKNAAKCIERRNLVLDAMVKCGYIDKDRAESTKSMPLSAENVTNNDKYSDYLTAALDELAEIGIDPYYPGGKLTVKTFMNKSFQSAVSEQEITRDGAIFMRDDKGAVLAYRSSIGNCKRQIASTAKPILVYAPAIDMGKLHIFTKIKDEPVNFNGYSPENYDKKYHGDVTVEESIIQSYNVPAVKTLNTLNFSDVEKYAGAMAICLKDEDKNLSLALGAMSEGMNLKKLCDAYSTFQNGGNYNKSVFIDEILDSYGKTIYKSVNNYNKVFSQGTASIINGALIKTAKQGTARKLNALPYDIASKTGTCGNEDGNTDAYAVSYTSDLCIGVWLGDRENRRTAVSGGNDCCRITNNLLQKIDYAPAKTLDVAGGTKKIYIDDEEYEKYSKIVICDNNCPKINKKCVVCLKDYANFEKSVKFSKPSIDLPQIKVNKDNIAIELCQTKYYSYLLYRYTNSQKQPIYDGEWQQTITDSPGIGEHQYSVIPYYSNGKTVFYGEEIFLPKIKILSSRSPDKIPDIIFKDWTAE